MIKEICPHCKRESGKRHLVDNHVVCWYCDKMSKLEDWYVRETNNIEE